MRTFPALITVTSVRSGSGDPCLEDVGACVVDTLVVGTSNVGTTAAIVNIMKETSRVPAGGSNHKTDEESVKDMRQGNVQIEQGHGSLNRTISSTISMQSTSNLDRYVYENMKSKIYSSIRLEERPI